MEIAVTGSLIDYCRNTICEDEQRTLFDLMEIGFASRDNFELLNPNVQSQCSQPAAVTQFVAVNMQPNCSPNALSLQPKCSKSAVRLQSSRLFLESSQKFCLEGPRRRPT